jgi:hypothetical protein
MPENLVAALTEAARQNHLVWPGKEGNQVPTSLDMLAPGAPALRLLADRGATAPVHLHSIIGETYGSGPDSSDGAVQFASAHLEGIDSECLVPANHTSIQHHPRAVLELRRILFEHLEETERIGQELQLTGNGQRPAVNDKGVGKPNAVGSTRIK